MWMDKEGQTTFDIGFSELHCMMVRNVDRVGAPSMLIVQHGLFMADDSDAESEEVLKVGVDLDDDDDDSDAESEEDLKVGIHLDGIHGSEMKCDSVNFKDCIGNVINCIELGTRCKQILFDANRIDVIDYHNPMRRSLDHATKKFVCNRQKMSNLQMDRPCDVLALLEIEPGILTTPMTDTEYKLLAQYQDLLEGPVEGQRTDNKKKMGSNRGNRLETPARVPKWLDEVDEIIKKYVEDVQEGSDNFPSNDLGCSDVKKKYRAGRDAFKLTKDIKALIEESNKIIFDKLRVVEQEVRWRRKVMEEEGWWWVVIKKKKKKNNLFI
ncbi:hypothetical protein Tco_1562118 [Tanacetum coccineum]